MSTDTTITERERRHEFYGGLLNAVTLAAASLAVEEVGADDDTHDVVFDAVHTAVEVFVDGAAVGLDDDAADHHVHDALLDVVHKCGPVWNAALEAAQRAIAGEGGAGVGFDIGRRELQIERALAEAAKRGRTN